MATFEQLIQRYPSDIFKKGQTLLLKDDIPNSVYVIESGLVAAYTIGPDGTERQIAIHEKGEDIPVGFGIGLTDHSEYFYEAYRECRIRYVPRKVFVQYLRSDAETIYEHYVHLDGVLMATLARISALEHPRAGDKVAFMLLELANEIGTRLRPHKTRLKLSLTQQEIADALGLTRETTGIELKKLEVKHILTHSRKSYVLYMERLRHYLDGR